MNVKEAAIRLEVSPATVYALVAAGKLRCHRVGLGRGCIRISNDHLADYLRSAEPVIYQAPVPPPARKAKLKHLQR